MKSQRKPSSKHKLQSARNLPVLDAAGELNVDPETLRRYIREGCPADHDGKRNLVNVPEVQKWMQETGHIGKQGRPWGTEDSPDLEAARLRKENALASKYELQTARERGELMPMSDVRSMGASAISAFRNALLGLPPKLAVMLEGRSAAERQDVIESELKHALDELSRRLEKLGDSSQAA